MKLSHFVSIFFDFVLFSRSRSALPSPLHSYRQTTSSSHSEFTRFRNKDNKFEKLQKIQKMKIKISLTNRNCLEILVKNVAHTLTYTTNLPTSDE